MAGGSPYRLLLAAMEDERRVGIGTVVIRTKQYLAAIRPLEHGLALSTMRFADEIVPASELDGVPARSSKPDKKELALASQIVRSLATDWKPHRYHDTYTEQLVELIERKAAGDELVVDPAEEDAGAEIIDLMEALEASLAGGGRGAAPTPSAAKKPAKKTSANKGSAKKGSATKASTRNAASRKTA